MKNIIQAVRRFTLKDWGGTESLVFYQNQGLSKLGYSVRTFCTSAFENPGTDFIDDIEVYRFPYFYPLLGLSFEEKSQLDRKGGDAISFPMFFEILKSKSVDLIHNYSSAHLGGMIRTACKIKKIPYVLSLVGGYYGVPDADRKAMMAPTEGHINYGKVFSFMFGRSRDVLMNASAIICNSMVEYAHVRETLKHEKVYYVPSGVSTSKFQKGQSKRFREKYDIFEEKIILNIARIDPQKNQILLVKIFPNILEKFPNTKLVLVGQVTNKDYYDQLIVHIKENNLQKNILIIEGLKPTSQEIVDTYMACDVFVLPSVHEGQPVVLLEVMAAGRTVVSSNVGGIQEIIDDGINGMLFNPNSQSELIDKILLVLSDKELSNEMGKRGQDKVKKEFDWEIICARVADIYEEAFESSRK